MTRAARHNEAVELRASTFTGKDAEHAPSYVRIEGIEAKGARAGSAALHLRADDGSLTPVAENQEIAAADFGRLVWNSADNDGGSFRFVPLDSERQPYDGVQPQTVNVYESPAVPDYASARDPLAVAHDQTLTLGQELFAGNTADKAPSFIRIEKITPQGDTGSGAALQRDADGDGPGAPTAVSEGDVISAADFGKLSWNAAHNDGGSFRFVPLDANQKHILGASAQTITVSESPAAPDYPTAREPLAVAHDQTLTLGQELFAGNAADKAPSFIRIEKITPQGDTGAGAALQRDADGDGPAAPTAVSEGNIISAADFGKLSWNSAHNDGGSFRFVPLDANQKPILGASAQTITVSESPAAPDYPAAREPLSVAHDQTLTLGQELFTGSTSSKAPAFIRIDKITPNGDTGAGAALQRDADGDGPGAPTAVSEGDIISAADFGKLSWNTAHNDGGSFRFVPLDANRKPILGAPEQTITVHESPTAPVYPADPVIRAVAHEQTATFPESTFAGTNQDYKPAAIRIEAIEPSSHDGASPSLQLRGDGTPTPVTVGQTITAENFGKLTWNTVGNEGGSFRFVPLDGTGQPYVGVQPQTISVYESPAAPEYPSARSPLAVAHDQTLTFGQELFVGSASSKAPAFIRIEKITAKDGDGTGTALQRDADGDGPGAPTAVSEGDVISAADFGKLSWNTAHNDGGSFRFVALDANRKPILGADSQTITVSESPAVPDYPSTRDPLSVAHDQTLTLGQDLFAGNTANKAPSFIRIESITPQDGDGTGTALQRDDDGAGPAAPTAVQQGDVISAADFGKLSWNTAHNNGGSFSFMPLDANQKPILGASAQTITVSESPAAPDYPAAREPLAVAHDQTLTLGQELFAGNAADKAPSFIRIEKITPQGDTGTGASLQRDADGDGPGASTAVSEGDVISAADFDKLSWNTAHNDGGSFRFVQLDANQKPILGASAQTITVSESPAAPDYPAAREPLSVAHDQTLTLGQELFTGSTSSKAPAFIRIDKITPNGDTGAGAALQRDADGDGPGAPTAVSEGDIISAADFGKLSWNTAHNDGGSFRFVPLDANRKPILGAPEQTITVHESPTAPVYPADPVIRAVAHEQTATFPESTFAGTNQDYKPAAIRIEAIEPSSHDGASPSLQLRGDGTPTPVTVGQTITAENFGKLTWNTVGNEGGSFRFVPLDGTGQPYVGVQPQTISVYESPAAPEYPSARSPLAVAHDQTLTFGQELFVGSASSKAPAFIRIEKITAKDGDGTGTALQRDADGDGPGAPTAVSEGDVISAADFGKLSWNTAHNDGGSFRFVALDANRKPILGADSQTITVSESPAVPDYPSTRDPLSVAHDQTLTLGQDLFAGNTANKAPSFIRIESITPQDGDGTGTALQRDDDGAGPAAPTAVQQGDVISAADFGKLSWNTAHNDGGSFRFVALDANQKPILGADAQTVTVHESPKAPDYSGQALQVVAHDQVRQIDASIFEGNDPARKPAFVTINQISPEKGANPAPLYIQREGGVKEAVQAGGTIRAEDFGKVHWDTSTNDGGRFTFTAHDAEQYAIEGSAPRTVTVHESPLPPVWNAISLQQQTTYAAHDGSGAFNSGMAYNGYNTPANQRPAAIRITHIDEKNPSGTEHSALYSWDGAHRTPLSVGSEVKFGRYSNIRWDTAHNEGGTFRFVALDKDGIEIAGSAEQTMTVIESPAAPVYASHMPSVFTPYNRPLTLDRTLLAGTDPSREPTAIQITNIYEKDDTAPGTSALAIDRGHGQLDPVSKGSRILASDLDKLVWRSDANSGGSFTFSMIGADGKPILTTNPANPGSTSTLTRTIYVEEGDQSPVYAQASSTLRAAFQQVLEIGKNHLDEIRGTDTSRAPARIHIVSIEEFNDRNSNHSSLQLTRGPGGESPMELSAGRTIDAEGFSRLIWDASETDSGRFTFKPLDKNGHPFVDDSGREVVRTITIDEQPQAAGTPTKPVVAPNAITGLDKSIISSNSHSPDSSLDGRFFKVISIEAYESPNAKRVMNWDLSGRPLSDGGQSGPTAYEVIRADGISLADAQQRAQDMGGKLLSIDDAAERGFIKANLFNSGPDISTRYHYINQGNVAHDAGSGAKGFIIEYENYRQPLKLNSEHDPDFSGQVEEGQIIVGSELNQAHLGWDSSKNHGGVITLVEVRGQEVEDGSGKNPALLGNRTKLGHLARDARDPDVGHERFTITITEAEDGSTTFGKPAVSGRSAGTSGHREAADTLDAAELLPGTPSAGSDTATRALPSTLGNLWHGTDPLLHDPLGQHPPLA